MARYTGDVNFEELARSCDDFNGAQLKAVCVEAGMLALRREAEQVRNHGTVHGPKYMRLTSRCAHVAVDCRHGALGSLAAALTSVAINGGESFPRHTKKSGDLSRLGS